MSKIKMTSGQHNTILLDKSGKVWCFGHNQYGQNGNGKKTGMDANPFPEQVIASWGDDVKITDVCAGHNHAAALDENGKVWYWGWDNYAAPPFPGAPVIGGKAIPEQVVIGNDAKITQIAGGGWHMLALDDEGTLWSWGSNSFGQLGIKSQEIGMNPKGAVFEPTPVDALPIGLKIKSFAAGGQHSVVLTENGEVWAFGWNQYGQLGSASAKTGMNAFEKSAVKVDGLDGIHIVKVAASYYHTMAMDDDGNVYAWGSNQYGQLGNSTILTGTDNPEAISATPVKVMGLGSVCDIAAGYLNSVVLDTENFVWSWGYNLYGQVGVANVSGGDFSSYTKMPMKITEWRNEQGLQTDAEIVSIMCLTNHTMAVDTDDNVWGWGFNRYGQLGNGASDDMNPIPTLVMWPVGAEVSPEPFALTHVTAADESGELKVEQVGFHVTVHADFGKAAGMLKDITLKFTDTKGSGILAGITKNDVRIMEDRFAVAFASHTHIDFDNSNGTVTLGLKLRDKDNYSILKTVKLRFVHEYNEYDMPTRYDVYYISFAA